MNTQQRVMAAIEVQESHCSECADSNVLRAVKQRITDVLIPTGAAPAYAMFPQGCTCPDDSGSCDWCNVCYNGAE